MSFVEKKRISLFSLEVDTSVMVTLTNQLIAWLFPRVAYQPLVVRFYFFVLFIECYCQDYIYRDVYSQLKNNNLFQLFSRPNQLSGLFQDVEQFCCRNYYLAN